MGKVGKFPEQRACFYAAEITLAIDYVHDLGKYRELSCLFFNVHILDVHKLIPFAPPLTDIVYRDLKPENVLLDSRGRKFIPALLAFSVVTGSSYIDIHFTHPFPLVQMFA